jgi:hypothetical protein
LLVSNPTSSGLKALAVVSAVEAAEDVFCANAGVTATKAATIRLPNLERDLPDMMSSFLWFLLHTNAFWAGSLELMRPT